MFDAPVTHAQQNSKFINENKFYTIQSPTYVKTSHTPDNKQRKPITNINHGKFHLMKKKRYINLNNQ